MMLTALVSFHPLDDLVDAQVGPVPMWALGILAGNSAVMWGAIQAQRAKMLPAEIGPKHQNPVKTPESA